MKPPKVRLYGTALPVDSLGPYAQRLYDDPGASVLAVVELAHEEFNQPKERQRTVKLSVPTLEVAPAGAAERVLRELAHALYVTRTAAGTFDEDQVTLAEQTIELATGLVGVEEAARLRVVLDWVIDAAGTVVDADKHRDVDRRRLLREILTKAAAARDTGVQLDLAEAGA